MWHEDTEDQEYRAAQLWKKHESFLSRKKHEDEVKQDISTTDQTWDDILRRRFTKSKKHTIPVTTLAQYQMSPWRQNNIVQMHVQNTDGGI